MQFIAVNTTLSVIVFFTDRTCIFLAFILIVHIWTFESGINTHLLSLVSTNTGPSVGVGVGLGRGVPMFTLMGGDSVGQVGHGIIISGLTLLDRSCKQIVDKWWEYPPAPGRDLGVTLTTGQPRTCTWAEARPCQLSGCSRTNRATTEGKKLFRTLWWPSV